MTGDTLCTGMRSMGAPKEGLPKTTLGLPAAVVARVAADAWGEEASAAPG
jgi:hypothetical protein